MIYKIISIIVIIITILIIIGIMVWVSMQKQKVCNIACLKSPSFINGPGCLYVMEDTYDATIPKPTPQIYLGNFTYSAGAGNPFLLPVKYALRYVRNDGSNKYGPLGPWSDPIYVGASKLPCIGGSSSTQCNLSCNPFSQNTSDMPKCNLPTIATITPYDVPVNQNTTGYTVNVHRIVGSIVNGQPVFPISQSDSGEIVGYTVPITTVNGNKIVSSFTDAEFNPNK